MNETPGAGRAFCTTFDARYVTRAVVMWESLRRWCPGATLHAICCDEPSALAMKAIDLPGVTVWPLSEVEAWDPALPAIRSERSWAEYLWTATPIVTLFSLERSRASCVTYLDADLMFFSSVEPIFAEMGDAPLLLTPMRHAPAHRDHMAAVGRFAVQFVPLRRDPRAEAAFGWWRDRCLENCSSKLDTENDLFGDQKYLERWPKLFEGVHILRHPGAGLGPWNVENHELTAEFDGDRRRVLVDGASLIFFHYSHFRRFQRGQQYGDARFRIRAEVRESIFGPYVSALDDAIVRVALVAPGIEPYDAKPTARQRLDRVFARLGGIRGRASVRFRSGAPASEH